jgi:hypothetical protein
LLAALIVATLRREVALSERKDVSSESKMKTEAECDFPRKGIRAPM